MRIWSLHPKYLDSKGLAALWRETLLAKNVLEGKTKGYKNHPQLNRFKELKQPVEAINQYLSFVYDEAINRAYNFNKDKINWKFKPVEMQVTSGQIQYERLHLLRKLEIRDNNRYTEFSNNAETLPHPMFKIINGGIEKWEVI